MLKVFGLEQSQEWDEIVVSFIDYDSYWLSGYVKAFYLHGDGTPLLFFFQNSTTRGMNVVMKRSLSNVAFEKSNANITPNELYDFSTPYGYGGWLIEGSDVTSLFSEYEQWCRDNKIVSEFVRFHPVIKNQTQLGGYYDIVSLGMTVKMDLSSPKVIWDNITSKNRNMIRKAQKNGIRIYNGRNPEIFRIFKKIYNATMDKDHADEYYYFDDSFYDSLLNDLSNNAQIFYAELDGKVIASSIMLEVNGRMNYHLSGSIKEYASFAPTNLLLYQAALWGSANGYKTLYLGGGVGSSEDSLYKFKKSFNRQDNDERFYIGKKIFMENEYVQLVEMHGGTESDFFPKYRA